MFETRLKSLGRISLAATATLVACGDDGGAMDDGGSSGVVTASSSSGAGTTTGTTGAETTGAGTTTSMMTSDTGDPTGTTGPNADPVTADDLYTVVQGTTMVQIDDQNGVLANDSDPDGDMLMVSGVQTNTDQGGLVMMDPAGGFTYFPPGDNFFGEDRFTYTADDGRGGMADGLVRFAITPTNIPLADVAMGQGGYAIDGEIASDQAGRALRMVGDVNGDGLDDMVIGAALADPGGNFSSGRVYVVFGKNDTNNVSLTQVVNGNGGFVINGAVSSDQAGRAVDAAGDVNGDMLEDIVLGVPSADPNGSTSGQAYVIFGKADGAPVDLAAVAAGMGGGFVMNGEAASDSAGEQVAGVGDLNGDMLDDIVIGADGMDPGAVTSAGRVYVVFGRAATDAVELSDLGTMTNPGFVIDGALANDAIGYALGAAGDVNGDMTNDIVIGARFADPPAGSSAGQAYVVFGKADMNPVLLSDVVAGNGGGFALNGEAASDNAGWRVRGATDVDGDGMDDVLVAADDHDTAGNSSGRVYVVWGKNDFLTVDLAQVAAGNGGYAIDGAAASDTAGSDVAPAGDFNGDMIPDFIIGATEADPPGVANAGRAYIVYGKTDGTVQSLADVAMGIGGFVLDGELANDDAGFAVDGGRDTNGDGLPDVVVSAHLNDVVGSSSGRAYVLFGTDFGN